LSLTLSSAFLLRAAVEAASKLGVTCCEPLLFSMTLGPALIDVFLVSPTVTFPLGTICRSAPAPPSNPTSAEKRAATAGVGLQAPSSSTFPASTTASPNIDNIVLSDSSHIPWLCAKCIVQQGCVGGGYITLVEFPPHDLRLRVFLKWKQQSIVSGESIMSVTD
jgi:hypothetical protein